MALRPVSRKVKDALLWRYITIVNIADLAIRLPLSGLPWLRDEIAWLSHSGLKYEPTIRLLLSD